MSLVASLSIEQGIIGQDRHTHSFSVPHPSCSISFRSESGPGTAAPRGNRGKEYYVDGWLGVDDLSAVPGLA